MAHILVGARTFVKDKETYAYKQRTFLGIENSAVLEADELNTRVGYIGKPATVQLVDPSTKEDGKGEIVEDIPTDFRMVGISILDQLGISKTIQATMFDNFVKNYTKEQRKEYVALYDSLNKDNEAEVKQFVHNMLQMLG